MYATEDVLRVWRKFDHFPMETLTKAWFFKQNTEKRQREVSLMKEHREQYGITGNCFDLAIWLMHEFENAGVEAYPIGHHLGAAKAHIAVIAKNEQGNRYLCDLGDQWLQPILVDTDSEDYCEDKLKGFFPGAEIQVKQYGDTLSVLYHRPNGKVSTQSFNLAPVAIEDFSRAAEISQNTINKLPLLECRIPYKNEIAHWEFYNWRSFLSTTEGIFDDPETDDLEQWCARIHQKTGYDEKFLFKALQIFRGMR